jgi:hypothetical protein
MHVFPSRSQSISKKNIVPCDHFFDKNLLFESHTLPWVSISEYVERFFTYDNAEPEEKEALSVATLIYIGRISSHGIPVISLSFHRIFAVAYMLACKFFCDFHMLNTHYAILTGIKIKEMNCLEREAFFLMNHKLYISDNEYRGYKQKLYSERLPTNVFPIDEGKLPVVLKLTSILERFVQVSNITSFVRAVSDNDEDQALKTVDQLSREELQKIEIEGSSLLNYVCERKMRKVFDAIMRKRIAR